MVSSKRLTISTQPMTVGTETTEAKDMNLKTADDPKKVRPQKENDRKYTVKRQCPQKSCLHHQAWVSYTKSGYTCTRCGHHYN